MFKLLGAVKKIDATVQVSEKFSKREFVITDTASMYPQDILFQATQDKCSVLDAFKAGDVIEVSFNLRGREWTSPTGEVKYFNTLEAWRVEAAQGATAQPTTAQPAAQPAAQNLVTSTADDDLPF